MEIDIKQMMLQDKIPRFRVLFYDGKCFNTKQNDIYYNTIGKYKEEKFRGNVDEKLRGRMRKINWFWDDVLKYKKGEVDIEYMVNVIDAVYDMDDKKLIENILHKKIMQSIASRISRIQRRKTH